MSAPDGSCLIISTSCPPILRHAGFSPNLRWYHIGVKETSAMSSYTPLMHCCLPLMPVHCSADRLNARRASTNRQTFLQGPKSTHNIRDHFTCQSENIVYCISCRRCNCLYIGETGKGLRERFSKHLHSIPNQSRRFPVSISHSLDDIMVCGLKQCSGSNISRKQHEMKLIFKLGTL